MKNKLMLFNYFAMYIILLFTGYYSISSSIMISGSSLTSIGKVLNFIVLALEVLGTIYIAVLYWHLARAWKYEMPTPDPLSDPAPLVNIIIPTYNEPFRIVKDTFDAARMQEYPKDRFRVIVADDSPMPISGLQEHVEKNGGIYVRRESRKGFKGGAINFVLGKYPADYFAIFDSDHVSEPDFLRNTVGIASKDPNIFLVQERADFVNIGSWMRKASAFIHSQFFGVFQRSRHLSGNVIFAGTTALLNQDIVFREGGILEDTIAEDTDTSIVLASKGYRGVFYDKIGTHGLVPWDPISGVRQIWRWNNGLSKAFRLRIRKVIGSKRLGLFGKTDFLVSLFLPTLGVLLWLLNFILLGMLFADIPIIRPGATNLGDSVLFLIAPILVSLSTVFMGATALIIDSRVGTTYNKLPFLPKVVGVLLFSMYTMAIQPFLLTAIGAGLLGLRTIFNRTPKSPQQSKAPTKTKYKYAIGALVLFLFSFVFAWATWKTFMAGDPRVGWFSMAMITSAIPFAFVITGFKGLEQFIEEHSTVSVSDVLGGYE